MLAAVFMIRGVLITPCILIRLLESEKFTAFTETIQITIHGCPVHFHIITTYGIIDLFGGNPLLRVIL
jgi:hypothetical protein